MLNINLVNLQSANTIKEIVNKYLAFSHAIYKHKLIVNEEGREANYLWVIIIKLFTYAVIEVSKVLCDQHKEKFNIALVNDI